MFYYGKELQNYKQNIISNTMTYKIIIVGVLLIATTSCSSVGVDSLSGNATTFLTTGKTSSDWAISFVMKKDCKLFRFLARPKRIVCQGGKNLMQSSNATTNTFHKTRRSKISKSILDEIEGIGPNKKRDLLKYFGSSDLK